MASEGRAGRGRRKTADPSNGQTEMPGRPPSDRIWDDYCGVVPIDRVDAAFGGFKVSDRDLAAALQQVGSTLVVAVQVEVKTHKYETKHDSEFGDTRGRVVVTLVPKALTLRDGPPIIIDQETATEPEEDPGDGNE